MRTRLYFLASALLVAGCSSATNPPATPTTSSESTSGTITVFAAASLKNTFTDIGNKLTAENPGAEVTFTFAGSSDLVAQLQQGAPGDVFASADTANMTKATSAGLISGAPVNFATNTLTIVTAPSNPTGIGSFADLAKAGNQVVVCAPQVPCGAATKKIETATGTTLNPVSEESSVTDVLNKITTGQADAGVVYVTDAKSAGNKVATVPFTESSEAVNTYPIGVLKDSANTALAQKFVSLVTGAEGQAILSGAGFAAP